MSDNRPAQPSAAAPVTPAGPVVVAAAPNPKRKRALTAVAVATALFAAGYGVMHFVVGSRYEDTDNAYVQGNLVQITPQVGGTVLAVQADDTDFVKAGQSLVRLDAADAQVALDQAEAQLAQAVREIRTTYATNATLAAQVALRQADAERARAEVLRAQDDVARRQPLLATGAVGREEFSHAQAQLAAVTSAHAAARSAVVAAREQLTSNQALTEGISIEQHPSVQRAAARVREAYLALKRIDLPAPVDGHVARRSVQLGQRVQAGTPLMTLIPLDQLWVDANFKEGQLRKLRIGQPAMLTADVYGSKVEYHGRVVGLGAGTGSAFSLLPAQNATGNWIKVVQRVPVRVALDPKELAAHPLRVGLSMNVKVDVRDQNGKTLADAPRTQTIVQTAVFNAGQHDADAAVQRIIAANLARLAVPIAARPAPAATAARPAGDSGAAAPATQASGSTRSDPHGAQAPGGRAGEAAPHWVAHNGRLPTGHLPAAQAAAAVLPR